MKKKSRKFTLKMWVGLKTIEFKSGIWSGRSFNSLVSSFNNTKSCSKWLVDTTSSANYKKQFRYTVDPHRRIRPRAESPSRVASQTEKLTNLSATSAAVISRWLKPNMTIFCLVISSWHSIWPSADTRRTESLGTDGLLFRFVVDCLLDIDDIELPLWDSPSKERIFSRNTRLICLNFNIHTTAILREFWYFSSIFRKIFWTPFKHFLRSSIKP